MSYSSCPVCSPTQVHLGSSTPFPISTLLKNLEVSKEFQKEKSKTEIHWHTLRTEKDKQNINKTRTFPLFTRHTVTGTRWNSLLVFQKPSSNVWKKTQTDKPEAFSYRETINFASQEWVCFHDTVSTNTLVEARGSSIQRVITEHVRLQHNQETVYTQKICCCQ